MVSRKGHPGHAPFPVLVKEAFRQRRHRQRADGQTPGGAPEERHALRVPAEGPDVPLDPAQRL